MTLKSSGWIFFGRAFFEWNSIQLAWRKQTGMVLLLGLALLAGLSLLAIMAASSMLQQRQMAANHADGELARLSAITAVAAGEKFLLGLPGDSRMENCQADCFDEPTKSLINNTHTLPANPELLPDQWWLDWGQSAVSVTNQQQSLLQPEPAWALPGRQPPLFVIEELEYLAENESFAEPDKPMVSGIAYYRILGRGTGIAANTTHVAESILARPWQPNSMESEPSPIDCTHFRPAFDCGRMAYRERR